MPDLTGERSRREPGTPEGARCAGCRSRPKACGSGPRGARVWNFIGDRPQLHRPRQGDEWPIPTEPILFNKLGNCIVGPNDDVMLPKGAQKFDYEVEIAFVIGTRARYVEERDALAHIAGYTICNDVSERQFQVERKGQWMKGKCFETAGPLGPWLVTRTRSPTSTIWPCGPRSTASGGRSGSTANMIFKMPALLAYISQFMVLEPGDVVTTGTPAGVALGMKPPVWLKAGDEIRMGIDGLGEQQQRIVPFRM